jgi:hypothetical protein
MSTRNLPGGKGLLSRKADLTAICESDPQSLTTIWASTTCYRDGFTFLFHPIVSLSFLNCTSKPLMNFSFVSNSLTQYFITAVLSASYLSSPVPSCKQLSLLSLIPPLLFYRRTCALSMLPPIHPPNPNFNLLPYLTPLV